jgi:polyhydroxybutyrate depolymerase
MRRFALAAGLALSLGACHTEPPRPRRNPTAQQEASALLEQARRDIEAAPPEPQPDSSALQLPEHAAGRLPLLVFLHGLGGSGSELSSGLHLQEYAEQLGFAFLAPDGMLDHAGRRFWNASDSCCNFENLQVDHIALLRGWLQQATQHPQVDPARVYLVGYSNGGFLAYRAACELGSALHGIFSIGGAGPNPPYACRPDRAPAVVEIHGDADPIVSFNGGYLFADRSRPAHPSTEASLRTWRKLNGCAEPAAVTRDLDLEPRIAGAETQVWSYPNCSGNPVELWRVRGGGHAAGLSRLSVLAIWEQIQALEKPPAQAPPAR